MNRTSSRREIVAAGAAAGLLPLLQVRKGRAQPAFPRRFIAVGKWNGTAVGSFFPPVPAGGEVALANVTLPPVLAPLERRKQDLVILGGVEQTSFKNSPAANGHHSCGNSLTGVAGGGWRGGGISLDQWLAQKIGATVSLPHPLLNLGAAAPNSTLGWMSYRGPNQPAPNENNPYTVFGRLFASKLLGPGEFDRIRAERKSILDAVKGQTSLFGKRLATEDRSKLEIHLESLRELEKRLASTNTGANCVSPELGAPPPKFNANDRARIPEMTKLQMDLVVSAMACDLTRVATLRIQANDLFHWLGQEFADANKDKPLGAYHDITHNQFVSGMMPLKVRVEQWHMEMLLHLLDRLAAVPEGAGTMLDNTVVLLVDDMGNGSNHAQSDMPWVLAGRAGGRIRTGRYLHPGKQSPHNGVLSAIATAFGFEVAGFGDPKYAGHYPRLL